MRLNKLKRDKIIREMLTSTFEDKVDETNRTILARFNDLSQYFMTTESYKELGRVGTLELCINNTLNLKNKSNPLYTFFSEDIDNDLRKRYACRTSYSNNHYSLPNLNNVEDVKINEKGDFEFITSKIPVDYNYTNLLLEIYNIYWKMRKEIYDFKKELTEKVYSVNTVEKLPEEIREDIKDKNILL